MGLFRQEAINAQRERAYGDTLQLKALSYSWLVALAVFCAAALLAFGFWGQHTRKTHVQGYLAPSRGLIKIYPPEPGTVIEKKVAENARVKRGDVLFVLSLARNSQTAQDTATTTLTKLQARRDSLTQQLSNSAQLEAAERRTLEARARGLSSELAHLDTQLATQQRLVTSAQTTFARYGKYGDGNFFSAAHVQQKQDELLAQQARLEGLRRERSALERELDTTRQDLHATALRAREQPAALEREIAAIDQQISENESRRTAVVVAPSDGVATTILAEVGQAAGSAQPLMSILPAGAELRAELLVPSRAIGFVRAGQRVAVRYAAFPYQNFGSYAGRVREISRTLIAPNEANLPVTLNEPAYRITVALEAQQVIAYGKPVALQSGMQLDADIAVDRRRLIEWVFDPLLSVVGRV